MKRRTLLAGAAISLPTGTAGCLGDIDVGPSRSTDVPEYDCSRFDGEFGALSISVPREVPEDAALVELEETTVLSVADVSQEFEAATAEYEDAEEVIEHYGLPAQRVGWVPLGNGDRYAAVDAALSEFESAETLIPRDVWYAEYDGDVFRITLHRSDHPVGTPNTNGSSHTTDDPLEVSFGYDVPDSAEVIDAKSDLIPESEFFVKILEVARCRRESGDYPDGISPTMEYYVQTNEVHALTDFERDGTSWYVEYKGEYYVFDIHLSAH